MPAAKPKNRAEAKAVSDAEEPRIRYRAGQQAQGTVMSAEQIVGEIETAQHIEAGTRDAHDSDGVVVHAEIVD